MTYDPSNSLHLCVNMQKSGISHIFFNFHNSVNFSIIWTGLSLFFQCNRKILLSLTYKTKKLHKNVNFIIKTKIIDPIHFLNISLPDLKPFCKWNYVFMINSLGISHWPPFRVDTRYTRLIIFHSNRRYAHRVFSSILFTHFWELFFKFQRCLKLIKNFIEFVLSF